MPVLQTSSAYSTAGEIQSAKLAGLHLAGIINGRPVWGGTSQQFSSFDIRMAWLKILNYRV